MCCSCFETCFKFLFSEDNSTHETNRQFAVNHESLPRESSPLIPSNQLVGPTIQRGPSFVLSSSYDNLIETTRLSLKKNEKDKNIEGMLCDLTNLVNLQTSETDIRALRKDLKKLLKLIPQRTLPDSCSICLETLSLKSKPYQPLEMLHGCQHCFHKSCVSNWRRVQKLDLRCCPECRRTSTNTKSK
mmetsp:Transcript_40070/g.55677  ORF Transcript_40070/g.55677 Transcript_40070/m.55677 type:complete len:187 (+) Transcript_40070:312-872(+)